MIGGIPMIVDNKGKIFEDRRKKVIKMSKKIEEKKFRLKRTKLIQKRKKRLTKRL